MKVLLASLLALMALTGVARAEEAGDPAKGAIVFKKCIACHAIGAGAKTKVGPPLNGIVGAHWAHFEGYPYSAEIKAGAEAGKVWEPALLDEWIANPKSLAPKTKMTFAGVKNEQDRADLIAYLGQYDAEGTKK